MLSACFRNAVRMLSDYCPHVIGIAVRITPEYALKHTKLKSVPFFDLIKDLTEEYRDGTQIAKIIKEWLIDFEE